MSKTAMDIWLEDNGVGLESDNYEPFSPENDEPDYDMWDRMRGSDEQDSPE